MAAGENNDGFVEFRVFSMALGKGMLSASLNNFTFPKRNLAAHVEALICSTKCLLS